jgi:hypothetical protein
MGFLLVIGWEPVELLLCVLEFIESAVVFIHTSNIYGFFWEIVENILMLA